MAVPRVQNTLSAVRVTALKDPGKHQDGGGLRLIVSPTGAKRWVARVSLRGRRIEKGLGSFPAVSLEDARDAAAGIRKVAGIDIRADKAAAATKEAVADTTFVNAGETVQRRAVDALGLEA